MRFPLACVPVSLLFCLLPIASVAQSATSQLTPSSLVFPTVGVGSTSNAETVYATNYGTTPVGVSAITLTGPFTVDKSNCGTVITGCYVFLRAVPVTAGPYTGTLTLTTTAGTNTVSLSGTTLAANLTTTVLTSSGAAGAYSLTGTVTGSRGTSFPTGALSFLDTANGNLSLGAPALVAGTSTYGLSSFTAGPVGGGPGAIASGDFNGDGKLDLVVANSGSPGCGTQAFACPNTLSVLIGNGDGTFATPTTLVSANASGVVVADFNGDGKLDIAATDANDGKIFLFLGKGDGTFTKVAGTGISAGSNPFFIVTADFNGDGKADLAVLNYPSAVTLLLGNGDGTFTLKGSSPTDGNPSALAVGDFNGDGKLDIAVACTGVYVNTAPAPTIDILLGTGTGTFTSGTTIVGIAPKLGTSFGTVAVGDFNGDKKLDLATIVADSVTGGASVVAYLGKGDGTFTPQTPVATADSTYEANLGVADFNGDGKLDISLVDDTHYAIFLGNGDGSFKTPVSAPGSLTNPNTIPQAVGDFNGDGLPDIAVADGDLQLIRLQLSTRTETASATSTGVSIPGNGTHALTASYAGDTNFAASTSSPVSLTASPVVTRVTLIATPATVTFGGQVALQATLSPFNSGTLKTDGETITFSSGATTLGTAALTTGVATLNLTSLPIGTDSITAAFAADANFTASTSTAAQVVVTAAPPAVTLSPASLTFTIQSSGVASPAQTVTITNTGGSALVISSTTASGDFTFTGTCSTVAAGASCPLSVIFTPTAAGTRTGTLTLVDNAAGSPQTVALTGTGAPIAVTAAATSLTIANPGGSASTTLQIAPATGFTGNVALLCAVNFQGMGTPSTPPTCALSPTQVTLAAGTAGSSTLTIATTAAHAELSTPPPGGGSRSPAFALAGLLMLGLLPLRRKAYARVLMLFVAAATIAGCSGSSNSSTPGTPATTIGTYQVIVTSTANSVNTNTTITLNLQ